MNNMNIKNECKKLNMKWGSKKNKEWTRRRKSH